MQLILYMKMELLLIISVWQPHKLIFEVQK